MNFNINSVESITRLSKRQIDYWDRTHFIKPSIREASGRGSVRLYSFIDLVQFVVAKTLRVNGISLQKIRKTVSYLKRNFPDVNKPLAELKFLTDGDTIFVLTDDNNKIIDTLRSGQFVFSIALGEIIESLSGEVKELRKDKKYEVKVGKNKYSVILYPETEDGGYWVECPSLPGCASQGDTIEESLEMIKDAIMGYELVVKEEESKRDRETG